MNSNTCSGGYYAQISAANARFAEHMGTILAPYSTDRLGEIRRWDQNDIECLQLALALRHGYLRVTSPRHTGVEREFARLCHAARLPKVIVEARGRCCRLYLDADPMWGDMAVNCGGLTPEEHAEVDAVLKPFKRPWGSLSPVMIYASRIPNHLVHSVGQRVFRIVSHGRGFEIASK
jgi:hypothetical protein